MPNVVKILRERGLLDNVTSDEVEKLVEKPITVYAGFDPTSRSLQAGNFVTIMALAHFQRCGHRVIAVVGGATGLIGDPSGKSSEREMLSPEVVERNVSGIRENLSRFLDFNHPTVPAAILNNHDWLKGFTFIDFLREVGRHFRMSSMLGKDSVRQRLNSDAGMSYAEFSYQLLQAYDFLKLHDSEGCILQIGGSDQWGNITAGIDLIRKLRGVETYGLTLPLVCDSSGAKFGKSEGNAVYLDRALTGYYDFYQFFIRTADADVIRFLKTFTFLPLGEIREFESSLKKHPEERVAQRKLAEEITRAVHGEHGLSIALRASSVLFGESMDGLNADDLLDIFANVPSAELPGRKVEGRQVTDVAVESGLCGSKGEARRLIQSGGLYINNKRISDINARIESSSIVEGRILVLRSGKKSFYLVKVA